MTDRGTCLRCGGRMECAGREKLQLGQFGLLTGCWGQLFSGALPVAIWHCLRCGKLEFYADGEEETSDQIAEAPCPHCGKLHALDDPKCPHCGKRLME